MPVSPSSALLRSHGQLCVPARGSRDGAHVADPSQVAARACVPMGKAPLEQLQSCGATCEAESMFALKNCYLGWRHLGITGCRLCTMHAMPTPFQHTFQPRCALPSPSGARPEAGDRHRGAAFRQRGLVTRAGGGRASHPCLRLFADQASSLGRCGGRPSLVSRLMLVPCWPGELPHSSSFCRQLSQCAQSLLLAPTPACYLPLLHLAAGS